MIFKGLHTSLQDACSVPSVGYRCLFIGFAGYYWLIRNDLHGRTPSCVYLFFPEYAASREKVYVLMQPLFPLQIVQLMVTEAQLVS